MNTMSNEQRTTNNGPSVVRFIICLIMFTLITGNLDFISAMSWPSEDAVLLRNFGANDRGKPVLGMIFSGGSEVQAADRGEVIFSRSRNDNASRLPSPLGAWTAVDHGDGLISIYSRYADPAETDNAAAPYPHVEKGQQIAYPGISGWSSRDGFNFMIIDRRERRWVNPAMIITPALRTRNPQILSVELKNSQGQTIQSRNINQGRYAVLVNTISPPAVIGAPGINMAPQRITCLINGAETASLIFESFSARDGSLMVYRNGLVPARQIYSGFPSFEASEVFFTRGQVTLEIIVQDITGNTSGSVMRLSVN